MVPINQMIHQQIMGMFVSTIIFRINIDEKMAFEDLVEKIGNDINYIIKNHQNYPYSYMFEQKHNYLKHHQYKYIN